MEVVGPGRRRHAGRRPQRAGGFPWRAALERDAPTARLTRKGEIVGAFLSHSVDAISENRHGLVVAVSVEETNGRAERENALRMLGQIRRRHGIEPRTLGMDPRHDAGDFLTELERCVPAGSCRRMTDRSLRCGRGCAGSFRATG